MSRSIGLAGRGVIATFLASLLAGAVVAPTLAAIVTTNANPSVTVPVGPATLVNLGYTWNGTAPGDALPVGTTFAVTIPAGYSWTLPPTLTPTGGPTVSGPVTSSQTETWTLTSFPASGSWMLSLAGGTISATNAAGNGFVDLSVSGGASVHIATLTSTISAGTAVPVSIRPVAVPADGVSTIQLTFGAPTVSCANAASFTVTTTAGTFTTTNLPGVSSPVGGNSVLVTCANFGSVSGMTLSLQAPSTAGTAVITIWVSPLVGAATADSSTTVTFTAASNPGAGGGNHSGRDADRGMGKGARKTGFFAGTAACTAAQPAAGAGTFGFAILRTTGKAKLNVTVALKGVAPNATFTVQVDQAGTCGPTFTIHTNAEGNGNGHQRLALEKGATSFWVTATNGSTTYATKAVTLSPKHTGKGHNH